MARLAAGYFVGLVALSSPAVAQNCQVIADKAARLECYDKAASTPKKQQKAQPDKAAKASDPYGPAKQAMLRKLTDPGSAQWGDFWDAQGDYGPMVCGAVNSKNRMGGYNGMTGFIYIPARNEAILLFSGETDPNAGIATVQYRKSCLGDPRSDKRIKPPG